MNKRKPLPLAVRAATPRRRGLVETLVADSIRQGVEAQTAALLYGTPAPVPVLVRKTTAAVSFRTPDHSLLLRGLKL